MRGRKIVFSQSKFKVLNLCMTCGRQITGEPLLQRKDDTVEVLKKRLSSFHEQTTPVSFVLLFHICVLWFSFPARACTLQGFSSRTQS